MTAATTLPFRVLDSQGIVLSPWQVTTLGDSQFLEEELPGWDYQMPLSFHRSYSIDTSVVKAQSHLGDGSTVRLVVVAASLVARYRECVARSNPIVLSGDTIEGRIRLTLSSTKIAEKLTLTTELILVEAKNRSQFSANLPGSRLYQDCFTVQLEGNAGRFPMTTCHFAKDLPHLGISRAGWYLWCSYSDYSAPVTQGLMLFVNADRPEILNAVMTDKSPTLSHISFDIARQLLTTAVLDEDFELDHELYPDNSVGYAICGIMLACFPDRSKNEILNLCRNDLARFDAMIQSAVG